MSFADYTSLKTAIATDWMHRADLTTTVGDFITLFESDFNAEIRVRQMEQETQLTSTAGYLLHPSNWLGWKEIRGTSNGIAYEIEPVSDEVARKRSAGDVPPARMFKVKGLKTYLFPAPTATAFDTTYYQGVALSSGTNWLLTAYPGAYLYGGLLQAVAFGFNDARIPLWQQAYEQIKQRIKADSRKAEWSGQALRMAPDLPYLP